MKSIGKCYKKRTKFSKQGINNKLQCRKKTQRSMRENSSYVTIGSTAVVSCDPIIIEYGVIFLSPSSAINKGEKLRDILTDCRGPSFQVHGSNGVIL
jgi:hypothetical protein